MFQRLIYVNFSTMIFSPNLVWWNIYWGKSLRFHCRALLRPTWWSSWRFRALLWLLHANLCRHYEKLQSWISCDWSFADNELSWCDWWKAEVCTSIFIKIFFILFVIFSMSKIWWKPVASLCIRRPFQKKSFSIVGVGYLIFLETTLAYFLKMYRHFLKN